MLQRAKIKQSTEAVLSVKDYLKYHTSQLYFTCHCHHPIPSSMKGSSKLTSDDLECFSVALEAELLKHIIDISN